ncbi:MAG: hypothetical protein QOI63_618, partial [Thermoplasmata archaeon]|nr:hypothetical protein [Thermoplasmata archaeon]
WSTDGSALDDHYKFALHLDPRTADTDGDGLPDCQEVRDRNLTRCAATWPGPFDGGVGTAADRADTDRDGLADGAELAGVPVHLPSGAVRSERIDPLRADSDGDGLPDGAELRLGGDPLALDTDGDGCKDSADANPGGRADLLPGFKSLRWDGPSAHVRLVVAVAGAQWSLPANGTLTLASGENRTLDDLPVAPAEPTCGLSPLAPWAEVQVLGHQLDGTPRSLDFGLAGAAAAHLNVRTGQLARNADGTGPLARLVLAGPDGVLVLAPLAARPVQGT